MSYGFQCFGDAGNIQIDENYLNLVLVEKGTLTFSGNTDQFNTKDLSYTGEVPILCLAPRSTFVIQFHTQQSGSTWTWNLMGENGNVDYYIFDVQPNVETHIGLNVYTSSGRVAFNSEYKPMRINSIVNVTGHDPGDIHTQQIMTGGSGSYAASVSMPGQSNGSGFPVGASLTQAFQITSGAHFDTKYVFGWVWAPSDSYGHSPGPALVVDVGGM